MPNLFIFLLDDQKHITMLDSEFSIALSKNCGNGIVSKVGAFLSASLNICAEWQIKDQIEIFQAMSSFH